MTDYDLSSDIRMRSGAMLALVGAVISVMNILPVSSQLGGPMNCSATGSSCQAYLHLTRNNSDTLHHPASLFPLPETAIMQDVLPSNPDELVVSIQCRCSEGLTYQAEAAYKSKVGDTRASLVRGVYGNFAVMPVDDFVAGERVRIRLLCACTDLSEHSLLSYVARGTDTLDSLAIRFNASKEGIMKVNNFENEKHLMTGAVYYIPIRESDIKQAATPNSKSSGNANGGANVALGAVVGIVLAGLLLIAAAAALIFCLQTKQICCHGGTKQDANVRRIGVRSPCNVHSISFRNSKRANEIRLQCGPLKYKDNAVIMDHHLPTSMSRMNTVPGEERPIIFGYDEIVAATMSFNDSIQIGVGAQGPVHFGSLRDQEVAIKKMTGRKITGLHSKMTSLCKVYHANLVTFLGYSVTDSNLYLVHEYARNASVSDRLQNPHLKGFTPLTWNARVQIALDAAKGLDFIHQQNKAQCVHRAVKTNNILLDNYFRAKVADFGLATLFDDSESDTAAAKRPLTSFVYPAPESVRDGQVTCESDVYAFGVVLFELITGAGAVLKTKASRPDRPSLIAVMLSALSHTTNDRAMLKAIIDPLLLGVYSLDSVMKMARLGQQCVEEDPDDRPSMKHIVVTLSQMLLGCIEWGKALEGSHQIFNGFI